MLQLKNKNKTSIFQLVNEKKIFKRKFLINRKNKDNCHTQQQQQKKKIKELYSSIFFLVKVDSEF